MSKSRRTTRKGKNRPTCGGKRRYESTDAAIRSAIKRLDSKTNPPDALRYYHCPRCKGWHLTSQMD